ncbi:MAG: superoxide dismutase family protein [Terriglobales bacterium]
MKHLILTLALLGLAAGAALAAGKKPTAKADLWDAKGEKVATATLKEAKGGVAIAVQATGLAEGIHAFHIHAVGKCDAPDFKTAGGHFNPENKKHGMKNPEGPHAGDMPNIIVNKKGVGKAKDVNTRVSLGEGANSLFHEGGTALVIHAKADDDMSDPAGNAGDRIACGLIEKGQ